ncbi:MAG: hypothetical protein ACRD2Q_05625 [Terriglobales bacterium]
MTARQVIEQIEAAGGKLTVHGERIRCRAPREAADLIEELRAHRDEVRRLLEERQQPAGPGTSRLALFRVGMKVWTPMGPGIVVELRADRVNVQYEDDTRMAWIDGDGVLPMA